MSNGHLSDSSGYDIILIGGGLAGLSAAILLRLQGYSTLLFETKRYPFHRVCGEYISMESWPFLQRLGLELDRMNLPKITAFQLTSERGTSFTTQLDPGGFGISRYTLDATMADRARSIGVTVMDGVKVDSVNKRNDEFVVSAVGKNYQGRVVIGSWGKRSNLDRQLNRPFFKKPDENLGNWVGIKYHVRSDFPDDRIELHNFQDGYCGISRVDGGRTTLCYLVRGNRLKAVDGSVKDLEEQVLFKNPRLKAYFRQYPSLYEEPLAISQVNFQKRNPVEHNILMIGDSAGLIPPLTGNGMSIAMRSANEISRLVPEFLNGKISRIELEARHRETQHRFFSSRMATGRMIQRLFGGTWQPELLIRSANVFPSLADLLISLTHGKEF